LGIKSQEADAINDMDFTAYWMTKRNVKPKHLNQSNSRRICEVAGLLLDFPMQLSSLVSLPLDQVMSAAVGFRVSGF